MCSFFFSFTHPAHTVIYTLSLHDALPILRNLTVIDDALRNIVLNGKDPIDLDEISKTLDDRAAYDLLARGDTIGVFQLEDRKSTRLNSSHPSISYAVFCLKKKKKTNTTTC